MTQNGTSTFYPYAQNTTLLDLSRKPVCNWETFPTETEYCDKISELCLDCMNMYSNQRDLMHSRQKREKSEP